MGWKSTTQSFRSAEAAEEYVMLSKVLFYKHSLTPSIGAFGQLSSNNATQYPDWTILLGVTFFQFESGVTCVPVRITPARGAHLLP